MLCNFILHNKLYMIKKEKQIKLLFKVFNSNIYDFNENIYEANKLFIIGNRKILLFPVTFFSILFRFFSRACLYHFNQFGKPCFLSILLNKMIQLQSSIEKYNC